MKKAAVIRSVLLSIVLTILVFLFLATQARAEETLSPTGSKLAAVTVNPVLPLPSAPIRQPRPT